MHTCQIPGVHGNNRLGGNSLLDCVVFGRVSGKCAAQYMLGDAAKKVDLKDISDGGLGVEAKQEEQQVASREIAAPAKKKKEKKPKESSGGLTMAEVAKHTTNTDCWVVVNGRVLNVTKFLPDHPGGELAIMTFAGKDASEEFNMVHPAGVIEKYAAYAILGPLATGGGGGKKKGGKKSKGIAAPKPVSLPNEQAWGDWREEADDLPGVFILNVRGYVYAAYYLIFALLYEVVKTIFSAKNFRVKSAPKEGLTRSATFLIFFIVIHAVGNLHVFKGPDDFNGYGYFYVRLYWTGFGLPANIVEEYVLLAALLHVTVALKRTWDISLNYTVASGKLNLAMSGLLLLTFMTIHLFQFRFGETKDYYICPPPYLVNAWPGVLTLSLFWVWNEGCTQVAVRDIYRLEFEVFKSFRWSFFYVLAVVVFSVHTCLGWAKCVSAAPMGIPKRYQTKAAHIGYVLTAFIALIYISFPVYTHNWPMKDGWFKGEAGVTL